MPKLNEHGVLVPGTMVLRFDINLSGGHANNCLVQKVSRVLLDRLVVKSAATILKDTVSYDI